MKRWILRWAALLTISCNGLCAAQEGQLRLQLGSEGTVWAGQQITLNLDLLTTGQSFSNISFNLPAVEKAFLLQTDSSSIKLTERIDGQSWQVLRYSLALYAQTDGALMVPSFPVRFSSSSSFGAEPVAFDLSTPEISIEVIWPPGANPDALLVTTSDLKLEYQWAIPEPPIEAGDAVRLTVKRSAADISGMLMPELPVTAPAGMAAYPDPPEISDRSNRGQLRGTRSDQVTWVVEKPGQYRLPAIAFEWWNPQDERLETRVISGQSLSVAGAAPAQDETEANASSIPTALVISAMTLLILAFVLRPALVKAREQATERRKHSEVYLFDQVRKAAKDNDPQKTDQAIAHWLAQSPVKASSLSALADQFQNPTLKAQAVKLQEALIDGKTAWQGLELMKHLQATRSSMAVKAKASPTSLPAQLNPGAQC